MGRFHRMSERAWQGILGLTTPRRPYGSADRAACRGRDAIEAASNWARHIVARDYPDAPIAHAVLVVEVGEGSEAMTIYATGDVDTPGTKTRGMLSDGLRAHKLIHDREAHRVDLEHYSQAIAEQLAEIVDRRLEAAFDAQNDNRRQSQRHQDPRDPGQRQ